MQNQNPMPFKIPTNEEKRARFSLLPSEEVRHTFCLLVYNFVHKDVEALVCTTYSNTLIVSKLIELSEKVDVHEYVFSVQYSNTQLGDYILFSHEALTEEERKELYAKCEKSAK